MSGKIATAAARGILLSCDKTKLVKIWWTRSTQQTLGLCPIEVHEVCSEKGHHYQNQTELKKSFLADACGYHHQCGGSPTRTHLDQMGIKTVPPSTWTMKQQSMKQVE